MNPNNQDPIMVSPQPDIAAANLPQDTGLNPVPTPTVQPTSYGPAQPVAPINPEVSNLNPSQSSPAAFQPTYPNVNPNPNPSPNPNPNPQVFSATMPVTPVAPATASSPSPTTSVPYPINPTNPYAGLPPTANPSAAGGPGSVGGGLMPPAAPGMPAPFIPASLPKKSRKKLFIISAVLISLILAAVGYFGLIYLPNTPNNVWKTGMERTGKALTTVSTEATQKDSLEAFTKSKLSATVNGSAEGTTFSGALDTKYDDLTSNSELKFKATTDSKTADIGLKLMTELKDGKQYPDVYFNLVGLKALGYGTLFPDLIKYEGKWISVSSEYIAKNTYLKENDQAQTEQLTAAEVAEMARVVTNISDEYVFTSNQSKGVIQLKQFVAKEKTDGKDTYHYKASLNAENSKAYCKAIVEGIMALPSAKRLAGDGSEQLKKDGLKVCDEIPKETNKSTEEFDLWIDSKYKLIYKVRISDPENNQSYVDIGQDYKGTDDLTMFVNYFDGRAKNEALFSMTTNLGSRSTTAKLTLKNDGSSPMNLNIDVKIEPYDGQIDVNQPEGSIPIEDVIKAIEKSFNSL